MASQHIFIRIIAVIHIKLMVRKQVYGFFTCDLLNFSEETMSLSPKVKFLKRIISKWGKDK